MKRCLPLLLLLMACGGSPSPPPAQVGSAGPPAPGAALMEVNRTIAEREERDIDAWVERSGSVLERTGTGVRIRLLRDSAGPTAKPDQRATVRFSAGLIDGRVCYASGSQPETFTIERDNVESGLHEAVQRLSVGDSAVIVIPSHRAHGLIGDQDKIPMRCTVIYHIGLVALADT